MGELLEKLTAIGLDKCVPVLLDVLHWYTMQQQFQDVHSDQTTFALRIWKLEAV